MKARKKVEQEKLNEFFDETKDLDLQKRDGLTNDTKTRNNTLAKPFRCPSCHKALSNRKEPCKHCGYSGYIPMSDEQIKKVRFVLFIVILIVAVVVYILTR